MSTAREQLIELTQELKRYNNVTFDVENISLEGNYFDELSAFRAKREWKETLEYFFLLDEGHDFTLKNSGKISDGAFILTCHFSTACGRYAFWKLTNNQSPEAQYSIETAHIPQSESLHYKILMAPDLAKKDSDDFTNFIGLDESFPPLNSSTKPFVTWLRQLLKR